MTVIRPPELDIRAFRERSARMVDERFGKKYSKIYRMVREVR